MMAKRLLRLAGVLLMLAFAYATVGAENGFKIRVTEHVLPNGLKLVIVENHSVPYVYSSICFRAGSVNEPVGSTGVSHVLEHMMFKGTDVIGTRNFAEEAPLLERLDHLWGQLDVEMRKPEGMRDAPKVDRLKAEIASLDEKASKLQVREELTRVYERNGGGDLNAMTTQDATYYTCSFPSDKIELWGLIESEKLLHPVFRDYYQERAVIVNEYELVEKDSPQGLLYKLLWTTAFQSHPYRNPVIGWEQDLRFLPKKALEDYFKTFYVPNNSFIVLSGDITPESAIAVVTKYFGRIPKAPLPPDVSVKEPAQAGPRNAQLSTVGPKRFVLGFHRPDVSSPDHAALLVIARILDGGATSRLVERLQSSSSRICVWVDVFSGGEKYPDIFTIEAEMMNDHSMDTVLTAIDDELESLKNRSLTTEELNIAKDQIVTDFIYSIRTNNGVADTFAFYEACGDWRLFYKIQDSVMALTKEDIMDVAKRCFSDSNRTFIFSEGSK